MANAEQALKHFRDKYSDPSIGGIGNVIPAPPRMPSGVLEFDVASGGGWPVGNMSIIYGGKDTGKSNLAYVTIATYLENNPGMKAALMDLERNYDSPWGDKIGIPKDQLLTLLPDYGEQGVDMIEYLIYEAEDVGLIVVDSLAQLVPTQEIEKSAEKAVVGTMGLLISRLCKKTAAALLKVEKLGRRPTVIYTNQIRMQIGVMFGNPNTMPGGKSPGYYASTVVATYGGKEEVDADIDPSKPARKAVKGVIEKKKGPIVSKEFHYDIALVPQNGVRVGRSCTDWKCAVAYLEEQGQFGKTDKKKGGGYHILDQQFKLQKECRAWYEENRGLVRDYLIEHLMANPDDV